MSVVLMHAQGEPKTMQDNPTYEDVALEVFDYLQGRIAAAEAAGIAARAHCRGPRPRLRQDARPQPRLDRATLAFCTVSACRS